MLTPARVQGILMADGILVKLLTGSKYGQVGQVLTLSTSTALAEIAAGRAYEFQGVNPDGTMTAEGFTYPSGSNSTGAKQQAQATHVLTATDLVNGFFAVPITWPTPWADTNYDITFGLVDEYPGITIDYGVGDEHLITPEGFTAVVLYLGQTPITQGAYDNFDTNTQESPAFTPATSTVYQVALYLHPKSENSGNFAGDALQASVSYIAEDGENLTLTPSSGWNITAQDGPTSLSPTIYAAAGFPVTVNTTFTTYSIAGTVPSTTWFINGSFSGTPWATGTTITQVGGATAEYYGTFDNGGLAIIYKMLTGSDNGEDWSHGGVTFTVTGSPTQPNPTLYGPGGGVLQQAVTGASASELDQLSGTGIEHVGPGITGTADATHVWIDLVTGGVLIPSAAPVVDMFHYHMSLRVVQLPGPPAQIGSTVIVQAVAVHN
jgi:hypothetical protein